MRNCRASRRFVAAAAAFAAAVVAFAATAGSAAADSPVAAGWWWRAPNSALAEALRPRDVPEGGLYVSGAPDGPTAVSALRYEPPEDDGAGAAPALTLDIADEQGGDEAVLVACPAAAPWEPVDGGAWEQKPDTDCTRGEVQGERSPDGTQWTFDLSTLATEGPLDIVLAPGTVEGLPEGANGSTFRVAFQPPGPQSLTTTTASGGSAGAGAYGGVSSPSSDYGTSPSEGAPASPGGGGFETPGPADAAPTAPAQTNEQQSQQQQQAAPPADARAAQPASSSRNDSTRNAVLAGTVIAGACGALLIARAAQRQVPTLRRRTRIGGARDAPA